MLYTLVDWQRRLLDPWLNGLRLGAELPLLQRLLMAQHTLLERTSKIKPKSSATPITITSRKRKDQNWISAWGSIVASIGTWPRYDRERGLASDRW